MKETVQEPSLGDLFKEIWSLRRFILAGALSGIFLAGLWSYSATPYYRAWMILSPANPMNGAEISSLLADDNLFALRYLVQRVSVANSSDFMRFENIYDGPSVAKILLEQEDVLRGLAQDHAFRFTAPRRQSWSPEKLAEYLHDTVRLEPVNGSTLRRLSYKHPNPDFAKYFISGMHMVSDALIRRTIKEEAKARAAYLKAAVAETENPEHKRSLTTLLLEQERLLMLASLDQPYAAAIVEPAAVSFKPVWPDPALLFAGLTALGALAGFLAGSFRMPAVGGVFQKQQPGRRPVNAKKWFSGEKANSNHTEETPEEKPPSSARTVK